MHVEEVILLKRISIEEAKKWLDLMCSILESMQVASLDNEKGKVKWSTRLQIQFDVMMQLIKKQKIPTMLAPTC